MSQTDTATLALVCRVGTRWCALPAEHVIEIMRPLPVEAVARAPGFVSGLAVIRGEPVPVVDTAALVGAPESSPTRFVSLRIGDRRVALAVDSVVGLRHIPERQIQELPPLLRDANAGMASAIGTLDAGLLVVLRGAHLVPDEAWAALEIVEPMA